MQLKKLDLFNYRNYNKLELDFNSNLIILSGENAQGKTNIIESIFLSSTGRAHRTIRDNELILLGEKVASIKALVKKREGQSLVEIILSLKDNKRVKINSMEVQRIGELMGQINSVLFAPEDLKLVKGSPQERRRFMDVGISQVKPNYFYKLQQYNRVLNHRNNLLKSIRDNIELKSTLSIWNEQLAKLASYIMKERIDFLDQQRLISKEIHKDISRGENLEISYSPSINYVEDSIEKIMEEYLKNLEECQDEDIRKGSTSRGCHRDDILIRLDGIDARSFGSQGQARTIVLSLKLSEIEMMYRVSGEYPLLLLDDVMSELDKFRQEKLLNYFNRVQTFITTTSYKELPIKLEGDLEIFEVVEGRVTSL